MGWGRLVPLVILSYFLGSIPFGYLVGKFLRGVDVRRRGSGNIGATNVLRVLGPGPALVVLAGDVGKGALSVCLGQGAAGPVGAVACGIGAAVGGAWSVFLRFGGGKGMGVGSGIVLATMPAVACVLAPIWAALVAFTRFVSLGSVVISALAPVAAYVLGMPGEYVLLASVVGGIALVKHGPNIKRLIAGRERRLGDPAD